MFLNLFSLVGFFLTLLSSFSRSIRSQFDRKDIAMNKLVVTTLESRYRLYDMRTHHPVHGFSFLSQEAHKSTVWGVSHLPQNRDVFMTTGGESRETNGNRENSQTRESQFESRPGNLHAFCVSICHIPMCHSLVTSWSLLSPQNVAHSLLLSPQNVAHSLLLSPHTVARARLSTVEPPHSGALSTVEPKVTSSTHEY